MNIPFRTYWRLLVDYVRPHGRALAVLGLLLLAGIALQLVGPQILRSFVDTATSGGAQDALTRDGLLFLGIALLQQAASVGATYVGEQIGWSATNALRADLLRHTLRLDLSFHGQHGPGALIERIDGDVTLLASFFSQLILRVVGNVLLLIGVLALLFREDWRIGGALTIVALVALAVLYRLRDFATPSWASARQASADLAGYYEERLIATEDIRANGAVEYVMHHLYRLMRVIFERYRVARVRNHIAFVTARLIFAIAVALGLGMGAYFYLQGSVSLGTVLLVNTYAAMLSMPLEQIVRQLQDMQQAAAGILRVDALVKTPSLIADGHGAPLPVGPLSVAFEGVTFHYAERGTVIDDLSFEIPAGRVLGVLGRTGCGKTSLTRLLLRLYDPERGVVKLGGQDLRDAALADLRERVAMVTQDVQIFQASLRDNLTLFDETETDGRLWGALETLGLAAWARALPQGLDTPMASGARGLSAGEAQLLAFARVLLRDPGLVILDEASSRLDRATERRLERASERLFDHGRRTGLIIAHRLATVLAADDILILDAGRIVEHGPRERLLADPGSRFHALLKGGLETSVA